MKMSGWWGKAAMNEWDGTYRQEKGHLLNTFYFWRILAEELVQEYNGIEEETLN